MNKNLGARILGVGHNLPSKVLTNKDLEKIVDTTEEWIVSRSGIRERRIADENVSTHELAIPAAKEALQKAGIEGKDIDLVLCATSTPDNMFPSTACLIQEGIEGGTCPAFDLLAACSGFTYGLKVADSFIRSGAAKNVLLVASEIYSKIVNWDDRATCVLFGDAAAAVVLGPSNGKSGVIDSAIYSDGKYGDMLTAGGVGARVPGGSDAGKNYFIEMKGKETFKVAVKRMTDVSQAILEENGYKADDVDLVIPHQANIRIIHAVGKALKLKEDQVFINVQKYGNTSAASVPLALYEALEEGRLKEGDLVLLVTFGGGLTWGASLIRW